MTCPDCGGKFRWKCHDKVMSDDPSHKIEVNIFLCENCGNVLVIDKNKRPKPRNKGLRFSTNGTKPQIFIPKITEDEKKIYDKHKMSDNELKKYMKDIKKHTKKVCNAL